MKGIRLNHHCSFEHERRDPGAEERTPSLEAKKGRN